MKVLIIVPAYNEAEAISKLIDNLEKNYAQYDYVIINDGSKDQTKKLCREKGYHVLNLPINLGIGGAVQTGYIYASENEYDIAVQIDGDGQHNPKYIEAMIKKMEEENADIVIGSRFITREGFQSSALRRTGINLLSTLIKICTGKRINDVTSGYRIVNRRFIDIYADDYSRDYPEPEAIVTAVMWGGKIIETPVVMNERESGISSINVRKSFYYMIKVTLAIIVRRISYGIRRSYNK
ncbi:MAG: glycosyltransferase family 2 protein [Lachnospiraceae bacterium]|nr:glycosyltransferase family 2 protein [Lachnospiraceae bacterium]